MTPSQPTVSLEDGIQAVESGQPKVTVVLAEKASQ